MRGIRALWILFGLKCFWISIWITYIYIFNFYITIARCIQRQTTLIQTTQRRLFRSWIKHSSWYWRCNRMHFDCTWSYEANTCDIHMISYHNTPFFLSNNLSFVIALTIFQSSFIDLYFIHQNIENGIDDCCCCSTGYVNEWELEHFWRN